MNSKEREYGAYGKVVGEKFIPLVLVLPGSVENNFLIESKIDLQVDRYGNVFYRHANAFMKAKVVNHIETSDISTLIKDLKKAGFSFRPYNHSSNFPAPL